MYLHVHVSLLARLLWVALVAHPIGARAKRWRRCCSLPVGGAIADASVHGLRYVVPTTARSSSWCREVRIILYSKFGDTECS
eukprot:7107563-Karenia_brevis.AAC.1